MPELPDVEAVIKRIKMDLKGRTISGIKILDRELATPSALNPLLGKKIRAISRRGKFILILANGSVLVIHLRMTGDLDIVAEDEEVEKHTRLIISLRGNKELRFTDPRRLGIVKAIPQKDMKKRIPAIARMGPEPLSPDFKFQEFNNLLNGKKAMIKSALLDQSFIAGIGNIYGDEILFQSRIKPWRIASELSEEESKRLYEKIRSVLRKATEYGGNLKGFRKWFIHGRNEGRCPKCGTALGKVKIQGRYSYYCPRCQR